MSTTKPLRTEEEKREILRKFASRPEDQTAEEFCKEYGVTTPTLYGWRSVLTPEAAANRASYPVDQALADFQAGMTAKQVAKKYKIHMTTAYSWKQRAKAALVQDKADTHPLMKGIKLDAGGKRQFTDEDRERIIADWEASNASAKEYGKKVGIQESMLYLWRKNVRKKLARAQARAEKAAVNGQPVERHEQHTGSVFSCPNCGIDIIAALEQLVLKIKAMVSIKM